jgi:hypothetical protein
MSGPVNVEGGGIEAKLVPASEIPAMVGISYRQFDPWVRRGYIKADNPFPGSGYPRVVSTDEVEVARVMGELVAQGIEPAAAAKLAREIRADGAGSLGPFKVTRT